MGRPGPFPEEFWCRKSVLWRSGCGTSDSGRNWVSKKRIAAKYGLAAVATGLYAAAAVNEFKAQAESLESKSKNPRQVYGAAFGLTAMTWLVAWL